MDHLFRVASLQVSGVLLTARYARTSVYGAVAVDESRQCRAKSKRSGVRCKRAAIPGGRVCVMHGGATPSARAAAERRRTESAATALLNAIWDPDAAPITDPVAALQQLAGRLEKATRVLGARLDVEGVDLDGTTGVAWARVLRELRMALVEMERLGISRREIELAEGQARIVVLAFRAALEVAQGQLVPGLRAAMVDRFLAELGGSEAQPVVVRGEAE